MGFFDGLRRDKDHEPSKKRNTINTAPDKTTINKQTEENPVVVERVPSPNTGQTVPPNVVSNEQQQQQRQPQPQQSQQPYPQAAQDNIQPVSEQWLEPPQGEPVKTYKDKKPVQHVVGQTKIIAIINQKGGVGKSTTAINLSAALGEAGKQVLLIDLDPQGNTTSGFGVRRSQVNRCVYNVLLEDTPLTDVIIPDVYEGVDLVPATINLAGAEVELVSEIARENRLRDAVGAMRGRYDYVFIDCPPSLGLLTVNSLVAADKLIIPIQCEFYALEGVTKLLDSMKRVKNRLNPALDIFGILLTMYDGRTTLARQVATEVRNYFGNQVFETVIPRSVKFAEAPSYGDPITKHDPNGKGSQAYKELAKEVIKRG